MAGEGQRIRFADESSQQQQSQQNNNDHERQGARPKSRKPRAPPQNNVSWFTPLTQHGKEELVFQGGQGVPRNSNIDPQHEVGYWRRNIRKVNAGGKPKTLDPRWYFYYLGTGPEAGLKFMQPREGIVWVATNNALNVPVPNIGTRNPANDEAVPTTFAPGTKLPKGFYVEGSRNASTVSSANSSRSNSRSRSGSQSRGSSPRRRADSTGSSDGVLAALLLTKLEALEEKVNGKSGPKQPQVVTKKSAKETAAKPRQKRVAHKGYNVNAAFGRRGAGPYQGNFGNQEFNKLGTDYPRWPQLAQLAPTASAFFGQSKLSVQKNDDGTWLAYHGFIKLDENDANFPVWISELSSNINAYKDFPVKEKKPKKQNQGIDMAPQDAMPGSSLSAALDATWDSAQVSTEKPKPVRPKKASKKDDQTADESQI